MILQISCNCGVTCSFAPWITLCILIICLTAAFIYYVKRRTDVEAIIKREVSEQIETYKNGVDKKLDSTKEKLSKDIANFKSEIRNENADKVLKLLLAVKNMNLGDKELKDLLLKIAEVINSKTEKE